MGILGRATGRPDQGFQLINSRFKGGALNDCPTSQHAFTMRYEERKEVGKVFETVVRKVDQEDVDLAAVLRR